MKNLHSITCAQTGPWLLLGLFRLGCLNRPRRKACALEVWSDHWNTQASECVCRDLNKSLMTRIRSHLQHFLSYEGIHVRVVRWIGAENPLYFRWIRSKLRDCTRTRSIYDCLTLRGVYHGERRKGWMNGEENQGKGKRIPRGCRMVPATSGRIRQGWLKGGSRDLAHNRPAVTSRDVRVRFGIGKLVMN